MADILTITSFVPQSNYQAGGFDTLMGAYNYSDYGIVNASQDMLPAQQDGNTIYRNGSKIVGLWSSFTVDLTTAIAAYRTANGAGDETVFNGRCDRRIAFDASGNAYTLVKIESTSEQFLCCSTDYGLTWTAYLLPGNRQHSRIEFNDHPTRRPSNPPAVLLFNDSTVSPASRLELVVPTISAGVVTVGAAKVISSSGSLLDPQHSGGGNSALSWGSDKVLVAWPSTEAPGVGTRQYVSVYSRQSDSVEEVNLVGTSISTLSPDSHDAPAITVDSNDVFHVILGQHHGDLVCVSSGADGDYTTWNSPVTIDAKVSGGHTYMALVCDSTDRLHVVTRDATEGGYEFRLNYFRRSAAGSWAKVHTLIAPGGRDYYINYYHALSILEDDSLWVTGQVLFGQIDDATERATHDAQFPLEILATRAIATGGISGGPFAYGEVITGNNSQATGRYRYAVGNTIFYNPVSAEPLEAADNLSAPSGATATASAGPVDLLNTQPYGNGAYYNLQNHQRCHWPFTLYSADGDTWQLSTLTRDNSAVDLGKFSCGPAVSFGRFYCGPAVKHGGMKVVPNG